MRRTAVLAATILIVGSGLAVGACSEPGTAVVDGEGITGTLTVNGVDARGEEYSGTAVIEATETADRYTIRWLVTGAIQEGTGVLRGDTFDVVWSTISAPGGDASGTARYTLAPNGDLVGTRTIDGVDDVGTETIFLEP